MSFIHHFFVSMMTMPITIPIRMPFSHDHVFCHQVAAGAAEVFDILSSCDESESRRCVSIVENRLLQAESNCSMCRCRSVEICCNCSV